MTKAKKPLRKQSQTLKPKARHPKRYVKNYGMPTRLDLRELDELIKSGEK